MDIPRNEYPRPQLVRKNWLNLNGAWQFEMDQAKTGIDRGLVAAKTLSGQITVPFCPESPLSGVGYTDFMAGVWYKKAFALPEGFLNKRVLLHFEGADYHTRVWVNGALAGENYGCGAGFCFDVSALLKSGENLVTVFCIDDIASPLQPQGKQCHQYHSIGCHYTRTTGIWQTVWLEAVPKTYVTQIKYFPNIDDCRVDVELLLNREVQNLPITLSASFNGAPCGEVSFSANSKYIRATLPLSQKHLWGPGEGNLYDLAVTAGEDEICSYFGLRQVALSGGKFYLNHKPLFLRTVLDQGFYPDGIWTAPTDDALAEDIRLSMALGFNGARLHQKVFEQRFLYHADRAGYLVWGEYNDWGINTEDIACAGIILEDFTKALLRDFNHPSIIGWCPTNETSPHPCRRALCILYQQIKALDATRPVIDASGWTHVNTDMMDFHDYEQNPEIFAQSLSVMENEFSPAYYKGHPASPVPDAEADVSSREDYAFAKDENGAPLYTRKPYFMSEFGGIWWNKENADGWGYGENVKSKDEFIKRLAGLTAALCSHPHVCGFCYTQLTDVEQEQNGLLKYDRTPKFNLEAIRKIIAAPAKIEQ